MSFDYSHRLRVRYAETDAGGVAHHSSYIAWLEEARAEWMRARGASYRESEATGLFLMVTELSVRYLRSLRYDDEIEVHVQVAQRRRASIDIEYELRLMATGELHSTARTRLACTDRAGRLRRLPDSL